jgi:hypothetical protein
MSSTTKVNTSTVVNIPAPQLPSLSVPLGQEQKPMPNPHQKPIFPELPYFYIPVPASDPSLQSAAGREAPPKQSPSTDGDAGGQKNAELASGLIGAGGTLLALALCVLIWKFVRPCVRDFHRFRQNSRRGSRPTTPTTPRRQRSSSLLPMSPVSCSFYY